MALYLIISFSIVPSKSSEEYLVSGHTLADAVRKRKEIQVQIEEREKQEDEERVKQWAKTMSKFKEHGKDDTETPFDFMNSRLDVPQIPQIDADSQPFQALMKLEKQREKERKWKAGQRARMTTQERMDVNAKQNKRVQERKQHPTAKNNCPSIPWHKRIKKDGTPYKIESKLDGRVRKREYRAKKAGKKN